MTQYKLLQILMSSKFSLAPPHKTLYPPLILNMTYIHYPSASVNLTRFLILDVI